MGAAPIGEGRDVGRVEGRLRAEAGIGRVLEEHVDAVGLILEAQVAHATPLPSSGLTDMCRPGCSSAVAVPILKLVAKCDRPDSPAGWDSPGENVWPSKLPLVTASEICNACATEAGEPQ